MAFKDGGTVKKLAPGSGTVPGAPAPKNPSAPSVGLGAYQNELPNAPGTSTVNSGPVQSENGGGDNDLVVGGPISMPEAASSTRDSAGSRRGSQRAAIGQSGGRAPLIRPVPNPPNSVPKGGPIIPKGAPNYKAPPSTSTMRPKGK